MKKLLFLVALPCFAVTNSMTLPWAGGTTSNYPLQFGRPFVEGEIATCPQIIFDGTPITTQANKKNTWGDGSFKFGQLSALIPSLTNGTHTITFQNQGSCNTTALTKTQMLDAAYDFEATIALTNGSTVTSAARTMLNAWDGTTDDRNLTSPVSIWMPGSIAQTIILARHNNTSTCNSHPCSAFDIGLNSDKSFRPIYQATFWPTINKVMVRFIGENAQTEAIQDQAYSFALTTGNASPSTVYTHSSFTQSGATRWTKVFWIGGAPTAISLNHNLAYLSSTTLLPNYNPATSPNAGAVTSSCNNWTAASKDIGDAGNWTKQMSDAGSRPDIGIYEDWVVNWVYTGDSCLHDAAFGNADLQATWPVHVREGLTGRPMLRSDTPGSSTGLGHVISISGRPTINLYANFNTVSADQVNAVGTFTSQGWNYDIAHVPEIGTPMYLTSGDFYYLEEAMFWTAYDVAQDTYQPPYHRGPTGGEGILDHGQVRGEAWGLRNRIHTTSIIPDGFIEKTYISTLIDDAVSCEEGTRNITSTAFNGTTIWTYCRTMFAPSGAQTGFAGSANITPGTVTPLHQWTGGSAMFAQPEYGICVSPCSPATVEQASPLFETDYMGFCLGRGDELGFPTHALMSWLGSFYIGILTNPGFNPYILDNGRAATVDISSNYFANFTALKTAYNPTWQAFTSFSTASDPDGYLAYSTSAVSFLTGETGGSTAWSFLVANGMSAATYKSDPKWSLIPRGSSPPVGMVGSSAVMTIGGGVTIR